MMFSGFAETIRYIGDEEAIEVATGMKKYIIWPSVYTEGVRASVNWRSPTWLSFFLENGGSPNDLEFGSVWEMAKSGTVASIGIIDTLLRYGSDIGTRFQGKDGMPPQKVIERIEDNYYGIKWRELARRLHRGEELEGKHQTKRLKHQSRS